MALPPLEAIIRDTDDYYEITFDQPVRAHLRIAAEGWIADQVHEPVTALEFDWRDDQVCEVSYK